MVVRGSLLRVQRVPVIRAARIGGVDDEVGVPVKLGASLGVAATLVVGDYDHNLCDATVTAIDGSVVHLDLNLGTFRSSPEDPAATGD